MGQVLHGRATTTAATNSQEPTALPDDGILFAYCCSERLGAQSQEISRITGVIRDIAGQTNLLALNAAIEAAAEQERAMTMMAGSVEQVACMTEQNMAVVTHHRLRPIAEQHGGTHA